MQSTIIAGNTPTATVEAADKPHMNRQEVAEFVGISVRSVGNIQGTILPYVKINRRVIFRTVDVLKMLEAHKIGGSDGRSTTKRKVRIGRISKQV